MNRRAELEADHASLTKKLFSWQDWQRVCGYALDVGAEGTTLKKAQDGQRRAFQAMTSTYAALLRCEAALAALS